VTAAPNDDLGDEKKGPTPVPPRGGKGRGGSRPNRPANRPGPANRNARGPQARQAAQRRNRMIAIVATLVAVIVIAVIVVIGVSSNGSSGAPRQPASAADVAYINSVPMSTMVDAASKVTQLQFASTASGGTLTTNGKPEVLFIGAEFCPICAAERWPMTMALMKFGTFTNLQETQSAKADGDAGTWSYYGSTYTSQYLSFNPNELYTNQPSGNYYKPLDTLTAAEKQNWTQNEGSNEAFPFINFGGKEVLETAQYNPQIIYYKSFSDILSAVGHNDNTVGASIDASAAVFTKYLCGLTNNQPGNVCSAVAHVNAPVGAANTGSSTPASG
jgi:hypothetical protein